MCRYTNINGTDEYKLWGVFLEMKRLLWIDRRVMKTILITLLRYVDIWYKTHFNQKYQNFLVFLIE